MKTYYTHKQIIDNLVKEAKKSSCVKNKVASFILVRKKDKYIIISKAVNGAPVFLNDPEMLYQTTLHAEQRAIIKAAGKIYLPKTIILTTLAPCPECAAIILDSGIKECRYLFPYAHSWGEEYLRKNGIISDYFHHNLKMNYKLKRLDC